jgi:hypothetical protein
VGHRVQAHFLGVGDLFDADDDIKHGYKIY